jgi:hypothetical protein
VTEFARRRKPAERGSKMARDTMTYQTYALSMWRWISPAFAADPGDVQRRIDDELEGILRQVGLRRASSGEPPDVLLRYEAAPGIVVVELVDASTNRRVWRTDLRAGPAESLFEFGLGLA